MNYVIRACAFHFPISKSKTTRWLDGRPTDRITIRNVSILSHLAKMILLQLRASLARRRSASGADRAMPAIVGLDS